MEEPRDDQFLTYVLNLDRLRVPNQPKLDGLKLFHITLYLIQISHLKNRNLNNNPYIFQDSKILFAPHRCTPKPLGIDSPISVAPVFGKVQKSLYVRISVLYISYLEPVGKQSRQGYLMEPE